jgi:hypothetical protein
MLYEACAQIAILQQDAPAFERYAELVSREYRRGSGSGLSARFERLINEASRQGVRRPQTSERPAGDDAKDDWNDLVMRTMAQTQHGAERAQAALEIICSARSASSGQLYLNEPSGLMLAAMQGPAPLAPLAEVRDFVASIASRSTALDDMDTDAVLQDPVATRLSVGDVAYVLLPLACVQNDEQLVVGAVALVQGELEVNRMRENQLLNLIAAQLLGSHSLVAR